MIMDLPLKQDEPRVVIMTTGPAIIPGSTITDNTYCPGRAVTLVYQSISRHDLPKISELFYNGSPVHPGYVNWLNQQPAVREAFVIWFTDCFQEKRGKETGIILTALRWDAQYKHYQMRYLISADGVREFGIAE